MNKFIRTVSSIVLLGASFTFASCASKNFKEPIAESAKSYSSARTYNAPFDRVWEMAKDAVEERNIPVSQTVKEKGLMVSDWATGKSDRLYSGYGDTKIPYTIRFKFLLQVSRGAGNRTQVSIKSKEEYMTDIVTSGNNFNGAVYQWIPTNSTGFKEATLLDDISERLKAVD
jgi:uncharacterized lipoprotein